MEVAIECGIRILIDDLIKGGSGEIPGISGEILAGEGGDAVVGGSAAAIWPSRVEIGIAVVAQDDAVGIVHHAQHPFAVEQLIGGHGADGGGVMRTRHHRPIAKQTLLRNQGLAVVRDGVFRTGEIAGLVVSRTEQNPPIAVIAVDVQHIVVVVFHGAGVHKGLRVRVQLGIIEHHVVLNGADLEIAPSQWGHLVRIGLVLAEIDALLRVE